MYFHNSVWKGVLQALALYTCVKNDAKQNGVKNFYASRPPSSLKVSEVFCFSGYCHCLCKVKT